MTDVRERESTYDPFGADVMADPLPFCQILRDQHPAYWLPHYEAWAISRFQDVWDVLLQELMARVPDYEIDADRAEGPPSSFQWGWRVVPMVVGPDTRGGA
jgi:hypothetical protein